MPQMLDLDAAVTIVLERCGVELSIATPLGLGKPNALLNALYQRIKHDPARSLAIYTALSLDLPEASSELERRFLAPFVERHFGSDYPRLDYLRDLKAGCLPANVTVSQFYFLSGAMLHNPRAQRDYSSINYTFVARDLAEHARLDAIVQLVAARGNGRTTRYSLSGNPDVTLDVLDAIAERGGQRPLVIGVVHPDLPYLGGDAEVEADFFDVLVDGTQPRQALFALPLNAVDPAEYAIGLHASSLVRDGGTLQIGIGALSDAIVQALLLRHRRNAQYRDLLDRLRGSATESDPLIARCGGLAPFDKGLYGASEMIMDGFMQLRRAGILVRKVYDDLEVEQALAAGRAVDPQRLQGGHYLKGAFALGSKTFYAWLRELEGEDFDGLAMCRVSDINQLYGGREQLDAVQRRDARFFNTCMMATLLGAATSDALEDGRVVSGVGGQYNFVAMAHQLSGGRSVLLLRATRGSGRKLESNIRWNYGHTTIPRHLRDIHISEYGIADLRGRSDEDCIRAMLAICDARFVDALAREAIAAGKLARDYRVPDAVRGNTPEALKQRLQPAMREGLLPKFPFGSDFSEVELHTLPALLWLKAHLADRRGWPALLGALFAPGTHPDAGASLERLALSSPRTLRELMLARLVRGALVRSRH